LGDSDQSELLVKKSHSKTGIRSEASSAEQLCFHIGQSRVQLCTQPTELMVALVLPCCVCLSSVCRPSVRLCIVAKRFVLEQKLLLTAYRKSHMRNRLVPKWMTLTFV